MKKESPAPIVYPRENGYYLVSYRGEIQPAEYLQGFWYLISNRMNYRDHELEIGDKIDCTTLKK